MIKGIKTILYALALLAVSASSASALSTGFVPGQIWYSKDTLVAGDTVKVYTIVWNSQSSPVNVRVEFYDKNTVLGTRDVNLDSEQVREVSVPWSISPGDHIISAKIISSKKLSGSNESIVIDNRTTTEDIKFIPVSNKSDTNKSQVASANTNSITLPEAFVKTQEAVSKAIPESVRNPVLRVFKSIEKFRVETHTKIVSISKKVRAKAESSISGSRPKTDGTEAPVIKIKLFLLSIVGFLFATKIAFYLSATIIVFLFFRTVFYWLRDR